MKDGADHTNAFGVKLPVQLLAFFREQIINKTE